MWRQQDKQRLDAAVEENEQRLVFPVQTLLVTVDAPVKRRLSVEQQDPETFHIKEEQEELWTSLEGEQLDGNKETDSTRLKFTAVPMKCENKEEKPLFSHLHQHQVEERDVPSSSSADQMKAESDIEDCGGAETHGDAFSSSETEMSEDYEVNQGGNNPDYGPKTDNRDKEWEENMAPELGVNKSVSCSECGKQFLHQGSFQRHMTRVRSSSCSFQMTSVRVNNKTKSSSKIQTRELRDECGKRLKNDITRHKVVHTEHKPFVCDVCGQRFSQKINLNTHMTIHTGQKPLVCDVCGNRFSHKTNLNRHMRVHTGQKPFACDLCGHTFSHKPSLNTHMRVHTGQKPFACDICGHRFSQKINLNTHMRVHTGQKPFACDVCGLSFSRKTHLNTHAICHTRKVLFSKD